MKIVDIKEGEIDDNIKNSFKRHWEGRKAVYWYINMGYNYNNERKLI
jgi:hypothetical protein